MTDPQLAKPEPPHVFTLFVREQNPQLVAEPFEFRGRPACFSTNRSLWKIAEAKGTIWVVVSEPRGPGRGKLYRLAYKLVGCEPVERETSWGRFGVEGDPDGSIGYGSNDVETVLMAVRFANARPIESRGRIGFRLGMKQRLSAEGIERITAFADALPQKWSVFLSYSHDGEAEQAIWLEQELERHGKSVFRDGGALRAGQVWNEKIVDAIEGARYFLLLCSDSSANSAYVRDELQRALARPEDELTIMPVTMPGTALDPWCDLRPLQWVEWGPGGRDEALARILEGMSG